MKVSEIPVAVPAATTRVASGSGQAGAVEEHQVAKDRISIATPQQQAAVEVARSIVSSGRAQRVQEIINAVKSGQYYPSPQQIAQQLVSDAEVEVRLRAMLAR
jgi:anti-sigma28 factor (negative regulator of flagellin synthesis)